MRGKVSTFFAGLALIGLGGLLVWAFIKGVQANAAVVATVGTVALTIAGAIC
jgi:uncharacterized membrane protein YqjE